MSMNVEAATAAWGQEQAAADSAIYKRLQADRMASQQFLQAAGALAAAGFPLDQMFDETSVERPEHFLGNPKEREAQPDKADKAASKSSISNMPIQEQALAKLEEKLGSLDIDASDIPRGDARKIVDGTIKEDDYKELVADIKKKIARKEEKEAKPKDEVKVDADPEKADPAVVPAATKVEAAVDTPPADKDAPEPADS